MSTQVLNTDRFMDRISKQTHVPGAGKMGDAEVVARAKQVFRAGLSTESAVALETCIHCGMCSEACHFFRATDDPKYTPIHKIKPLRRFYRREISPMRLLYKLFTRDVSAKELVAWQELVFDSCTECGRCDQICPMGIRISPMVGIMRSALSAADLMPPEFSAMVREQQQHGTTLGLGASDLRKLCETLEQEGIKAPLDKEQAKVMVLTTVAELDILQDSFRATARIMNKLGADWTLRSNTVRAAHLCYISGDNDARLQAGQLIVEEARACGATTVIVPECGMAYAVLRWGAPNFLNKPPEFEVLAISEFIGREISEGRLKVKPGLAGQVMTYHDPCKLGRHGGVFEEPRKALTAIGAEVREMESHARTNFCCGGGSGVFMLERTAALRQETFKIKRRQVKNSGAETLVTACDSCRINLSNCAVNANWNIPIKSLACLVADNLVD